MRLFHRTKADNARAILAGGFRDAEGRYLTDQTFRGVWLSDRPLNINQGADGDTLLEVALDVGEAELAEWEWVEEDKPYREFLIPASVVNGRGKVRVMSDEEESSLEVE